MSLIYKAYQLLQKDVSISNAQIAKALKTTPNVAKNKVKELKVKGYIDYEYKAGCKRKDVKIIKPFVINEEKDLDVSGLIDIDLQQMKSSVKAKETDLKYKAVLKDLQHKEAQLDAFAAVRSDVQIREIKPSQGNKFDEATAIIQLSDWHFEEKVDPSVINNLNEYNLDIAQVRWDNCISNAIKLIDKERVAIKIDTAVIHLGGDFISGYIHEELEEDNYLSPIQATLFAKERIISGIEYILKHGGFKRIIIPCSFGNHGRTHKKMRISTGYKNSYEWMMYQDLIRYFQKEKRVELIVPNGLFAYVKVYDYMCRFFHGDSIKYAGGIGGVTIPLIKALHKYDEQNKAQYNFMGHFHTYWMATRNCIINGSGIGYSPYAERIGAAPENPVQSLSLIDRKRGMTIKAPIFC